MLPVYMEDINPVDMLVLTRPACRDIAVDHSVMTCQEGSGVSVGELLSKNLRPCLCTP